MSNMKATGWVGNLRYEVRGSGLVKGDLRRIVFHLLTVCDDFDPADFENVAALMGVASAKPLPEHDCTEARLEALIEGGKAGNHDLLVALGRWATAERERGGGIEGALLDRLDRWAHEQLVATMGGSDAR